MITPAGAECVYYYEDFARGARRQLCRVPKDSRSDSWGASDCLRCPVPGILAANASRRLDIRVRFRRGRFGVGRRAEAEVWCTEHGPVISDPHVGCPECNAEADRLLREALE